MRLYLNLQHCNNNILGLEEEVNISRIVYLHQQLNGASLQCKMNHYIEFLLARCRQRVKPPEAPSS